MTESEIYEFISTLLIDYEFCILSLAGFEECKFLKLKRKYFFVILEHVICQLHSFLKLLELKWRKKIRVNYS